MAVIYWIILILCHVEFANGGGCNADTGSGTSPASLGGSEQSLSDTGLAVRLSGYSTSCTCGIITQWKFYTRRNGTVVFYALSGTTVKGKTSISIPELSHDNYYEVPLSSDMWISVKNGYTLGFFTSALPMITYGGTGYNYYSTTGQSEVAVGSTGSFGGLSSNREYAVQAYIETGHSPMFTNLPYTVSIFTHDTGLAIITVSATDLDPDDVSVLSITTSSHSSYFTFSSNILTYTNVYTASATLTLTFTANDGCQTSTDTVTVELINEPPTFTNLPATVTPPEKGSGSSTIFTITTSDPAGETVLCYLDTTDASITPYFSINSATKVVTATYPTSNGGFVHDTRPAYDLPIRCSDNDNNVYSVLNVDLVKNEPPVYTAGSGYLPASVAVGRDTSPLYTLAATDAEGDSLTFSLVNCSRTTCPILVSTGGIVTTDTGSYTELPNQDYDVFIQVTDGYTNVLKVLSILVSEQKDFNEAPVFSNLPATIYVSENTPANTPLFKVIYTEINTWDELTLAKTTQSDSSANTYFTFDTSTGVVSVLAPFDYDTVSPTTLTVSYRVRDQDVQQDLENLTIVYVNVNEAPTISIITSTITVDEGSKDSVFTSPGLGVSDPDSGDEANAKWSLDCGADSKYFYIRDTTRLIYLAREYDMDAGLTGNATCVVSVIDPKGLSSTGTLTLSINNINDNTPRFPYHRYLFLHSPDDPFFTKVENLSATDADTNQYGSTLGTITYSFDTATYPQSTTYFQIDVNGVLYVRDVSSFTRGQSYVFKVFAVDSGSVTGTTTVSVIFTEVETVTTTTTERYYTFGDDFGSYVWLFIVCILIAILLVIIAFMVWFDPVMHDYVAFKLMRIDEWCRHKPKEPKRTVGKLTVTMNNKTLENDPDNALPWELLAKDANVPEMNQVQEEITKRKERREKDYMKLTGRNVFEKGKGIRPVTAEVEVHSSPSGSRQSDSPKYDFFQDDNLEEDDRGEGGQDNTGYDNGGPNQWDYRHEATPVLVVTPAQETETNIDEQEDEQRTSRQYNYRPNTNSSLDF